MATTSLKLVPFKSVEFGKNNIFGWDCVVMDTNFHPLYDMKKNSFRKGYGSIIIGDDNWFASYCKIMHSVRIPEGCFWALGTIVSKSDEFQSYSVHDGTTLSILFPIVMLDYSHYVIVDYNE